MTLTSGLVYHHSTTSTLPHRTVVLAGMRLYFALHKPRAMSQWLWWLLLLLLLLGHRVARPRPIDYPCFAFALPLRFASSPSAPGSAEVMGLYPGDPGPPGADMAGTVLDLAEHTGDHLRPLSLSCSFSLSLSLSLSFSLCLLLSLSPTSGRLAEDVFGEAPGCLSSYCLAPALRTKSLQEAYASHPTADTPKAAHRAETFQLVL